MVHHRQKPQCHPTVSGKTAINDRNITNTKFQIVHQSSQSSSDIYEKLIKYQITYQI